MTEATTNDMHNEGRAHPRVLKRRRELSLRVSLGLSELLQVVLQARALILTDSEGYSNVCELCMHGDRKEQAERLSSVPTFELHHVLATGSQELARVASHHRSAAADA